MLLVSFQKKFQNQKNSNFCTQSRKTIYLKLGSKIRFERIHPKIYQLELIEPKMWIFLYATEEKREKLVKFSFFFLHLFIFSSKRRGV